MIRVFEEPTIIEIKGHTRWFIFYQSYSSERTCTCVIGVFLKIKCCIKIRFSVEFLYFSKQPHLPRNVVFNSKSFSRGRFRFKPRAILEGGGIFACDQTHRININIIILRIGLDKNLCCCRCLLNIFLASG